jgi:predicted helicase
MPDLSRLQAIHTFPMLVNYLRDELEWPITPHDFEDLTFEYQPEELGIEKKYSNLIKNIRQLRPLTTNQPWGVFFINFDKEKLPVVMLRRILGALVVKKRASGQSFNRPSWLCNDLLFISTYGEETSRSISFGHFREREIGGLPTLRVVGWDKDSTQLRMEDAQLRLAERLRYPEDTSDLENWRETWSSAFKLRPREVITTSKALATRLAEIALSIRQSVGTILEIETENGPMRELLKSFQENLLHDLTEDGFADTYAQTLTYGLLSEKMIASLEGTSGSLASIKLTNPFLSELVDQCRAVGREQQQIDFDELGVGELEELLDNQDTKLDEVLKDFGRTATGEDPVLHFYELFLSEYNPQDRKQKGVFYTPKPVVSYIVRSVHELLQTEFGLDDGLADTTTWGEMIRKNPEIKLPPLTDKLGEERTISEDEPFVQILDPATGTATFLVETIDVIHKAMIKRWESEGKFELEQLQLWNDYVPKHLLPRLHGYELMMAPYAIAHMKIGIKLYETGYRFKAKERARIYLTNALEPHSDTQPELEVISSALAHEAKSVNEIKRHKRFTVVIGNPPYSGHSSNTGAWISKLVHSYHFIDGVPLGERNPKWLQDDYVKFIRLAQLFVSQSTIGILGYITNHSYSDNPTFRGMRRSLMRAFCKLRFVDLHGNSKKKEQAPDGSPDENVFDIQQGVAILLASRSPQPTNNELLTHAHVWGKRVSKYASLDMSTIGSTKCAKLSPASPFYLFFPQDTSLCSEFDPLPSIKDVLPINSMGVTTGDDNKFVAFKSGELVKQFKSPQQLINFAYRPFDSRTLYYNPNALARARYKFMRHMLEHKNLALVTIRRPRNERVANFFVSNGLTDKCFISSLDNCQVLPLYTLPDTESLGLSKGATPNFSIPFLKRLASTLGLKQSGSHGLPAVLTPEDIFHYAYAVFHSPGYRSRYTEFLKIDFPRLPLTSSLELFRDLSKLGAELVALHLMESTKIKKPITKFVGPKDLIGATDPIVEKASYSDETVWLDKAKTIGFEGVPEEVWNFHIGGYQVCEKWLKDRQAKGGKNPRPGRFLTKEDREHYQGIIVALSETIRLMAEIDQVIDQHGSWPGAFQAKNSNE